MKNNWGCWKLQSLCDEFDHIALSINVTPTPGSNYRLESYISFHKHAWHFDTWWQSITLWDHDCKHYLSILPNLDHLYICMTMKWMSPICFWWLFNYSKIQRTAISLSLGNAMLSTCSDLNEWGHHSCVVTTYECAWGWKRITIYNCSCSSYVFFLTHSIKRRTLSSQNTP